ncbi:MAG: MFS transporter [Lachnospiraceae bacterium]|nr:MFS transporter [Lachnospiraceae bacterium]
MRRESWYPFVMLGCATLVNFAYLGMVSNVIGLYTPAILEEFPEVSRSSFTVAITLLNLMAAVGNLLHTPVRERVTVRGMLALGWGLAAAGLTTYSLATSLPMFYLGGGLIGLSVGFCGAGTATLMVNSWFQKRRGTFVAVAMSGMGIGVALISPVISYLMENHGWRFAFRVIEGIVLLVGLVLVLVYRNAPAIETSHAATGGKKQKLSIFKRPQYLVFMPLAFLTVIVLYALMANLSVIAADMGYSTMEIGYLSSVAFAVNVAVQLPTGMCCDRFGSTGILLGSYGMMAVIFLTFLFVAKLPFFLMLVVAALFGFAKSVLNNVTVFLAQEIAPEEEKPNMVSLCVGMTSMGAAFGIYLVQLGYDLTGSYRVIYILLLVLAAVCTGLNRYLWRLKAQNMKSF